VSGGQSQTAKVSIALLCAGAAILIVMIAGDSKFGDSGYRAMATALVVVFFLLTAMAGAALARTRPELSWLGYLTVAASTAATLGTAFAIWGHPHGGAGKLIGITAVLAFAGAHSSLLFGPRYADQSDNVRLLRNATLAALAFLVVLVIYAIVAMGGGLNGQEIAVVTVLYALGAAVLPLARHSATKSLSTVPAATSGRGEGVLRLDHLVIAVSDLDRSNAFYADVLGAVVVNLPGERIAYKIGGQQLNVHGPSSAAAPLAAKPVLPGNSDLCFVWNGRTAAMVEHLRRHRVELVDGPVERLGAHGPGHSVYFRDPDGSLLELISYAG
jgi:catechol 2,3-dioxygenase-like lactoylglutathione lyase family enzyme